MTKLTQPNTKRMLAAGLQGNLTVRRETAGRSERMAVEVSAMQ